MPGELISIIIPCKDYEQFVKEAIDSAVKQTYPNIEIIVVDDASVDHSVDVIESFPEVKLIKHIVNKGLPATRNDAIREAKGKYIIPLDADDTLFPQAAEKIIEAYTSPDIGIVRFGLVTFGDVPKSEVSMPPPNLTLLSELENNQIYVSSSFPKTVWDIVGGYSEDFNDGWEDWEFWIKIMRSGYRVATINEPLFFYRIHPFSKGRTRPAEKSRRSRNMLIHKHYDAYKNEIRKQIYAQ